MQQDTTAQEGDLAVVYREEIQPVTEESEFSSCIFPQTVVLEEAFTGNIYGRFRAVDQSGMFDGNVRMSSSRFRFDGWSKSGNIRVEYTSSDGITYTRIDGREELQEFGTVIKYEPMEPWNDVIGNFMKIGGNYFEGIYTYKNNSWKLAPTQLTAAPGDVYKQSFYGKNGVESGTLGTPDNSFADTNAEVYNKIQNQYENMEPRVLTNSNKTIDKNIYFIPVKKDGTPLLYTSKVTDMSYMFNNCSNLTTIPLLNTSNVRGMPQMFNNCSKLTTIPLLDTSKVTNMDSMFVSCSNLTTIPLLDTSKVTNMYFMFYGCKNLITIPQLNTSNVTNMKQMFQECSNLTTIPLLDTSKVTGMSGMFNGCSNLTTIPLLDTSKVTEIATIFNGCTSLSDDSLNNIMQMCINATSYTDTDTKTLQYIGLTSEQADKCKTLSNYSAFTSAGWTTGY